MSKLTGPVMSLSVAGSLAGGLTFQRRGSGVSAGSSPAPTGAPSASQIAHRALVRTASQAWWLAPSSIRRAWLDYELLTKRPARQAFVMAWARALQSETSLLAAPWAPVRSNAVAGNIINPRGGVGQFNFDVSTNQAPVGWTFQYHRALVVKDQDPHDPFTQTIPSQQRTTQTAFFNFSGLQSGQLYICVLWVTYTKPDGLFIAGPSVAATRTVS